MYYIPLRSYLRLYWVLFIRKIEFKSHSIWCPGIQSYTSVYSKNTVYTQCMHPTADILWPRIYKIWWHHANTAYRLYGNSYGGCRLLNFKIHNSRTDTQIKSLVLWFYFARVANLSDFLLAQNYCRWWFRHGFYPSEYQTQFRLDSHFYSWILWPTTQL